MEDVRAEYVAFCSTRCKEKRCEACSLRQFMDAYLAMVGEVGAGEPGMPPPTMASPRAPGLVGGGSAGPVEAKIEDLIKQTKGGDILDGVRLEGRRVIIRFRGSALLKAVGIAISAIIRIFANFPIIWEVDLAIGDLKLVTDRQRAVALVGASGLDIIARDSKTFWNYFRPMVNDDHFAERIFKYLAGEENDAPALVHQANLESQQGPEAGF